MRRIENYKANDGWVEMPLSEYRKLLAVARAMDTYLNKPRAHNLLKALYAIDALNKPTRGKK
jgi:hypothetical protein